MKFDVDTKSVATRIATMLICGSFAFVISLFLDFQKVEAQGIENKKGIEKIITLLCKHVVKEDSICLKYK